MGVIQVGQFRPIPLQRGEDGTALGVAQIRAQAALAGLCKDHLACYFTGKDPREITVTTKPSDALMVIHMGFRTAEIDRFVRKFARDDNLKQVVILGAGQDTRAARLGPGSTVRYFELDLPATQATKLARIRATHGFPNEYPEEAVTLVPCDLRHEDFLSCLTAQGFRRQDPALFIAEGLFYYLEGAVVENLLRTIAAQTHEASLVVFDSKANWVITVFRWHLWNDPNCDPSWDLYPLLWGCDDYDSLLARLGFSNVRVDRFDQILAQRAATDGITPYEREYVDEHALSTNPFKGSYLIRASCTTYPEFAV